MFQDRDKIVKLHRVSQLAPSRKRLRLGNYRGQRLSNYVDSDSAAATSAELTTEDIVNQVREQDDANTGSAHEEEEIVSSSDVLVFLEKTRSFLGRCKDVPDDVHRKVEDVETFVLQRLSSTRQKKIRLFQAINCS
ncbi:hypothetical protein V5799_000780 [Amblyomma americanum]|uniref:Uncharacterized protein n=1 Tax=Amblyomma americanum TaxID=6943 RepID=A0AAQ4D232_AMBAM